MMIMCINEPMWAQQTTLLGELPNDISPIFVSKRCVNKIEVRDSSTRFYACMDVKRATIKDKMKYKQNDTLPSLKKEKKFYLLSGSGIGYYFYDNLNDCRFQIPYHYNLLQHDSLSTKRIVFNIEYSIGNYASDMFKAFLPKLVLLHNIYFRSDLMVSLYMRKRFFLSSGFSVAFTSISTVGVVPVYAGFSNMKRNKKMFLNYYIGWNFMNKESRFILSPTFNFNTPLMGIMFGFKIKDSQRIYFKSDFLISPHLLQYKRKWEIDVVPIGPDFYLALGYSINISKKQ